MPDGETYLTLLIISIFTVCFAVWFVKLLYKDMTRKEPRYVTDYWS